MEIRKVFGRSRDGAKLITIPTRSDIEVGDYVVIEKVDNPFEKKEEAAS